MEDEDDQTATEMLKKERGKVRERSGRPQKGRGPISEPGGKGVKK